MAKGRKTGGRRLGSTNKPKETESDPALRTLLRAHSKEYMKPRPQVDTNGNPRVINIYDNGVIVESIALVDSNGKPLVISNLDADMLALRPVERIKAEIQLLEYSESRCKAVDVNIDHNLKVATIEDRLIKLSQDPDQD